MRPVSRGASPKTAWQSYAQAHIPLEGRIGEYCSYCETPTPSDVEHKLPKHVHQSHETSWDNFLLSCKICNTIKRNNQNAGTAADPAAALALYLWPDTDNTARAFVYRRVNGDVTVAPGLLPDVTRLARATLEMTGIDRNPGKEPGPTPQDKRWRKRYEAWRLADRKLAALSSCDTPELRACIAELAAATGFWSVWRTVFAGDATMLKMLDDAFKGTAPDCFDPKTRALVARPGGKL